MKRLALLVTAVPFLISGFAHAAGVTPALDPNVEAALEAEFSGAELAAAKRFVAASEHERTSWREAIRGSRSDEGCYTVEFPSTTWEEVECGEGPGVPHYMGNTYGDDIMFYQSNGAAFDNVTGYFQYEGPSGLTTTCEFDPDWGRNWFTIQLNMNTFATTACAGSPNPSCKGWEQFIYNVPGDSSQGTAFIEFWIINYGKNCPSGQSWHQTGSGSSISCWKDSGVVHTPSHTITIIDNNNMFLEGWIPDSSHEGVMVTLVGTAYSHVAGTNLHPLGAWTQAEFNVYGYGNGSQAKFSGPISLHPTVYSSNATNFTANCYSGYGTTGETNDFSPGACGLDYSMGAGVTWEEHTVPGQY